MRCKSKWRRLVTSLFVLISFVVLPWVVVRQITAYRILQIVSREGTHLTPEEKLGIAGSIYSIASRYHIDPFLLLAVMKVESNFRISARSHKEALGLMQVKKIVVHDVADELNVPRESASFLDRQYSFNILVGAHYLSKLMDRFGDTRLALAAYNMGPTGVRPFIRESSLAKLVYPKLVMRAYEGYRIF